MTPDEKSPMPAPRPPPLPPPSTPPLLPADQVRDKPWRRRGSPLARQALVWWVALVVYGSLYPMSGWTNIGVSPFAYLTAPIPRWLTAFDLITNVIGYMPLGALVVFAVYPALRGTAAVLAALLIGTVLSGTMEAMQTYLPTRVASNLDLATNALGALIGATLSAPLAAALLDRGWLRRWRFQWFERHAGKALALLLLWPFAQMYPQPFLFGIGDWPRQIWDMADPSTTDAILDFIPGLGEWASALPDQLAALADSHVWEAVITALGVLGGGLMASVPMRRGAPRFRLIYGMLVFTIFVKAAVNALQTPKGWDHLGDWSTWYDWFNWLTTGSAAGMIAGAVILPFALRGNIRQRAASAFVALSLSLLLVNILPLNPYWPGVQLGWKEGEYRHLNDLAQWLAGVWPYTALLWLMASAERAMLSARQRQRRRDRYNEE